MKFEPDPDPDGEHHHHKKNETRDGKRLSAGLVNNQRSLGKPLNMALFGLRACHSGVTYAAVMPPSMIND